MTEEQVINAPEFEGERPIGFKACSFSWDTFHNGKKKPTSKGGFELCFEGEISFKRGAVNLILGPTASGKARISFRNFNGV